MELVEKAIHKTFIGALVSTILFVVGIPMIIFGAINQLFVIMGIGIAFVVVNFYAMPILWINLGTKKGYKKVVLAINNEHIYTVAQLAQHLSKKHGAMKATVSTCFEKGYLTGYLFDGENIKKNFNKPQEEPRIVAECEGCGAHFDYPQSAKGVCPYCGRIHQQD